MLKLFAAAAFGFAVLFGAIGPAAAGKGGHFWVGTYPYAYPDYSYSYQPRYVTRYGKSRPNIQLDRETESVWRNLRPSWFDY
ncbi:MAG TPA: hypothetical protein VHK26_11000 [Methyloceanibacter sp.]|jgi:hypothetical protein|nr:hypothetical protein [Methyloceanibacter sp.]